jgi:hypothetical protein
MPVEKFQRCQTDASFCQAKSESARRLESSCDRPLSEYDNITILPSSSNSYPLAEITFRFDDSLSKTRSMNNTTNPTAVFYKDEHKQTTTKVNKHQYENVAETLQMRNGQESDQQVNLKQINENPSTRSVMSDAKSSFFGLDRDRKQPSEDSHYMNVLADDTMPEESKVQSSLEKVSATSSISGSSSTTATPSSSPIRHDPRKENDESHRSKSPRLMLPESSLTSPSQVIFSDESTAH